MSCLHIEGTHVGVGVLWPSHGRVPGGSLAVAVCPGAG